MQAHFRGLLLYSSNGIGESGAFLPKVDNLVHLVGSFCAENEMM